MMKTICFIETGSRYGLRNLAVAKELGYRVVFVCENPDLYRVPSTTVPDWLAQADEIVVASDTFSCQSILTAMVDHSIDGVVASGDYHVIPAAEFAQARGLPHCDLAALRRGRRKDLMRDWLHESGVEMPRFAVLDQVVAASPIGYPCIVKPVDAGGSVGIYRADDDASFQDAVRAVLGLTQHERGFRSAGKALVEAFLEGVEMSAEAVWDGKDWRVLGLSGRRNEGPIGATEVSLTFPAQVSSETADTVYRAVYRWLRASGLNHGGAHVEFRVGPAGAQLLEINPRLAGSGLVELVRIATGFDPVAHVLAQAVGDHLPVPECPLVPQRAATLEFLTPHQHGTLRAIEGLEKVRAMPSVMAADITASTPREIAPLLTNYDFLGFVLAVADNPLQSLQQAQAALGQFHLDIV